MLYRALDVCYALQAWESEILMLCYEKQLSSASTEYGVSGATRGQISLYDLHEFIEIWAPAEVLPALPEWISPELPALNIARVAGHFFVPGMGLWAAHAAVFPISIALWYFAKTGRRDSPAFASMMEAFTTTKTGVIMRDFLKAIGVVWQLES
ncbi:hypothetical protein E4T50_16541 [Aureobasidium sp. EXF-12298]|nr:hypothetical protein E4T50_16541 [Aureobasidium sp. EXF-12298]